MNREIKFRGKGLATGEWLYGDLVHSADGKRTGILVSTRGCYDECEVAPRTIGQFTGLHDCNGKEIFEGDILRFSPTAHGIGYVRWDNELAQFVVVLIADRNQWYCIYNKVSEVVGNIHDNPELLKGE